MSKKNLTFTGARPYAVDGYVEKKFLGISCKSKFVPDTFYRFYSNKFGIDDQELIDAIAVKCGVVEDNTQDKLYEDILKNL